MDHIAVKPGSGSAIDAHGTKSISQIDRFVGGMIVVGGPMRVTLVPEGEISVMVRSPTYSCVKLISTPQIPCVGLERLLSINPETPNCKVIDALSGIGVAALSEHWLYPRQMTTALKKCSKMIRRMTC